MTHVQQFTSSLDNLAEAKRRYARSMMQSRRKPWQPRVLLTAQMQTVCVPNLTSCWKQVQTKINDKVKLGPHWVSAWHTQSWTEGQESGVRSGHIQTYRNGCDSENTSPWMIVLEETIIAKHYTEFALTRKPKARDKTSRADHDAHHHTFSLHMCFISCLRYTGN